MVVKSSKDYHIIAVFLFSCIAAFFFILLSAGNNILFPCIVALILTFIALRFWISVGRTFIFDDTGCTVSFFCFNKHYSWSELNTKRVEDYRNALGYRDPYTAGAIFSPKRIRTPLKLKPTQYSFLICPFSLIFVNFNPHIQCKKWDYRCPDIYTVERTEFLQKYSQYMKY